LVQVCDAVWRRRSGASGSSTRTRRPCSHRLAGSSLSVLGSAVRRAIRFGDALDEGRWLGRGRFSGWHGPSVMHRL
jgi:hypothetical protein